MISDGMASMAYYIVMALVAALVPLAATINLVIGSASARWAMLAPVLVFGQRWVPGFGMGSLIAAMLPYSAAFFVVGLVMTAGWVFLGLPLGPGTSVGFALPDLR